MSKFLVIIGLLTMTAWVMAGVNMEPVAPPALQDKEGAADTTGHEAVIQPTRDRGVVHTAGAAQPDVWERPQASGDRQISTVSKRPYISGSWVLNTEWSDNPKEIVQAAVKKARAYRSMGGPGRGHSNGRDGAGKQGWRGGFGGRNASFSSIQGLFGTSESLEISYIDPAIQITTASGRQRKIYTDNRGGSVSASGGGIHQIIFTAGWEKNALVIESTSDAGPDASEEFELQGDGQLSVLMHVRLPMLPDPVTIRRIYKPADTI